MSRKWWRSFHEIRSHTGEALARRKGGPAMKACSYAVYAVSNALSTYMEYVHAHRGIYVYMYIVVYTYIYIYTYIHTYTSTYIHTYIYI